MVFFTQQNKMNTGNTASCYKKLNKINKRFGMKSMVSFCILCKTKWP